jgi:signal peptidase II
MADTGSKSYRIYYYLIAIAVFAADQCSKLLVERNIRLHETVAVIPGFFGISHVLNPGAAFSMFINSTYAPKLLPVFASIVLIAIFIFLWSQNGFTYTALAFSLIMGGAAGNLTDRLRVGSVIDFLMFKFGNYYYPDFNLADSAIVIGSCILIAELFFRKDT